MEKQPQRGGANPRNLPQRTHRRLIGILGFLLPGLMYLVAGLRQTEGLLPWRLLPSVSAYYYTGAVGIFIGVLFALALFLFSYPGYEGDKADRVLGKIAGVAALGVALFPTGAPVGTTEPMWWSDAIRVIHYISTIVLFGAFILFSVWLFRKSRYKDRRDRPVEKRRRDTVCLLCGIAMGVSVLWAGSSLFTEAPIFWPEAIAIMAFAISWLVKGEAYQPVMNMLHRMQS